LAETEARGEQIWLVKITPKDQGKTERWTCAPLSGNENKPGAAVEAILQENDLSEIYTCRNTGAEGKVEWICTLEKPSINTPPGAHVFPQE